MAKKDILTDEEFETQLEYLAKIEDRLIDLERRVLSLEGKKVDKKVDVVVEQTIPNWGNPKNRKRNKDD